MTHAGRLMPQKGNPQLITKARERVKGGDSRRATCTASSAHSSANACPLANRNQLAAYSRSARDTDSPARVTVQWRRGGRCLSRRVRSFECGPLIIRARSRDGRWRDGSRTKFPGDTRRKSGGTSESTGASASKVSGVAGMNCCGGRGL